MVVVGKQLILESQISLDNRGKKMGGEVLILLLVFGAIFGLIAGVVVYLRPRRSPTHSLVIASITFFICLAIPIGLFLSYGSYIRATAPAIEIPSSNPK